jgi:hypothetical protein
MSPFEIEMARQGQENLYVQLAIAVGAFTVAVLAIWGDKIKGWLFGPRLEVSVQLNPPYCQRLLQGTLFRLKVENVSESAALNVELWIAELRRVVSSSSVLLSLVPIPLKWTHVEESVAPSINPTFHRYCDFGLLGGSSGSIALHLVTAPTPGDGSTRLGPGSYHIHLGVTASNSKARHFNFRFEVPNYLPPTEADTLEAVNLRLVGAWNP